MGLRRLARPLLPMAGLLLLAGLLLILFPARAEAGAVTATANEVDFVLFVEAGTNVTFQGHMTPEQAANATAYGWSFSRSAYDAPNTTVVNRTLYAEGRYNATFYVQLEEGQQLSHMVIVIVTYKEEASATSWGHTLFKFLGVGEMAVGGYLFWATWRLKQQKIYLRTPPRA